MNAVSSRGGSVKSSQRHSAACSSLVRSLRKFLSNSKKMNEITRWWRCLVGPRIYRRHDQRRAYAANWLENLGEIIITTIGVVAAPEVQLIVNICIGPYLVSSFIFGRLLFGLSSRFVQISTVTLSLIYVSGFVIRAVGRTKNVEYLQFLEILHQPQPFPDLMRYDFDFRFWPVDYYYQNAVNDHAIPQLQFNLPEFQPDPSEGFWTRWFLDGTAYVFANVIIRAVIYPGTLWTVRFFRRVTNAHLIRDRARMVEELGGERYKLQTRTKNQIDSMYFHRHNPERPLSRGNVLVISCEGNCGFYESCSAWVPLDAGYSVLGWNHPGFGWSQGVPWPWEDSAAIDVVVQFALNELGWRQEDIVIYGWSIGSFSATWASMNYPNIRGLILDASFDDVLRLAMRSTPAFMSPLAVRVFRKYINLHIEEQLARFGGPVLMVRRLRDEIMAIVEHVWDLETLRRRNRLNDLLKGLLVRRYPHIFRLDVLGTVDEYLAVNWDKQYEFLQRMGVNEEDCFIMLQQYVEIAKANGQNFFPVLLFEADHVVQRQRMALYLVTQYLMDFDALHGTFLPHDLFRVPHHPWMP